MSGIRYSIRVASRARELHAAGWSTGRIVDLLEDEMRVHPHSGTVRKWVDRPLADAERERKRNAQRRQREFKPRQACPETALWRMGELRDRGLSYAAIAVVAELWWGESIVPNTVRNRLERAA